MDLPVEQIAYRGLECQERLLRVGCDGGNRKMMLKIFVEPYFNLISFNQPVG